MSDLDDEELIATRRLNGLDDGLYESERNDINVDIKILKKWLHELDYLFEQTKINNTKERTALRNVLAEREADKKRIKELEEENQKYIVQLTDEQYRKLVDNIRKEVKQEFEQKVKDKIEDLRYNGKLGFEENLEETFKIEVLEELLEEK